MRKCEEGTEEEQRTTRMHEPCPTSGSGSCNLDPFVTHRSVLRSADLIETKLGKLGWSYADQIQKRSRF